MPVWRWGLGLIRGQYAVASAAGRAAGAAGRAAVVALAIGAGFVYLYTGLWFDLAYWVLGRFAARNVGPRARTRLAVAVTVLVVAALAANGSSAKPEPTNTPGIPIAGASTVSTPVSMSPAATPSPTPLDADDEAGASASPEASFSPAPTDAPEAPVDTGSASDRLPGEPDPALTPGALNPAVTQATIGSTICVSGWTATIRPSSSYTTALKIQEIGEYGYADTSTADYEEDHLISLELGGAPTDPRNLWPEPYSISLADGRPTGAHTKDGFETRLKNEVCAGTISLAEAQTDIGDDWVHAYYGIPLAVPPLTPAPSASPSPSVEPSASSSAAAGSLTVRISSLPASVKHGAYATLVAVTSPGATCSASVTYASGTVSSAAGLQTTPVAGSTGKVSWKWKVGTSTKLGTSTATVTCWLGADFATDSTNFVVT